jgi:putative membrane protein
MNKFTLTAAATLMMVSGSALAQSAAETSGVNSLAGVPPKTEDFVLEAASSDMFEIESSKLALERAGDDETKAFAQQMIEDHQKTSNELKQLVEGGSVQAQIPTQMTEMHQGMLDDLTELQGEEFTEEYHSAQEDAHEAAVDLYERYGSEGDNAELKAFAAKTLPALEHHLQMAEQLDQD